MSNSNINIKKKKFNINKKKTFIFNLKKKPKFKFIKTLIKPTMFPTVSINFTKNNCIVSLKNTKKQNILSMSIGMIGYKNTRKASQLAHIHLAFEFSKQLKAKKIKTINIEVKGLKKFRRVFLKELFKNKFKVLRLIEKTSIIHNGCKPPKKRRL